MKDKFTVIGVTLALALGVVGLFAGDVTNPIVERTIEKVAGSGQVESFHKYFRANATIGGNSLSTTTGVTLSSFTLSRNELGEDTKIIRINPSVNLALAIGATTTGALVPNIGDTAVVYLKNASSTVASTLTLSAVDASLGLNPSEVTGSDLVLSGLNWARLDIMRIAMTGNDQVEVLVSEWVPD